MLHKIMLIGHCHSTQFMEKHNLGIKTLEHNTSAANAFLKIMSFGHSHSTQFMEKHNLGITMLECNTSATKAF